MKLKKTLRSVEPKFSRRLTPMRGKVSEQSLAELTLIPAAFSYGASARVRAGLVRRHPTGSVARTLRAIQDFFTPVIWIVLVAAFNVPVICTVSPTYG